MEDTEILPPVEEKKESKKRGDKKGRKKLTTKQQQARDLKIIELRAKDMSVVEIAKVVDLSPQGVFQRLQGFESILEDLRNVQEYRHTRHNIIDVAEKKILKTLLDDRKLEEANLFQSAVAFREIYKARRLEDGLSTSNNSTSITQFTKVDLSQFKKD